MGNCTIDCRGILTKEDLHRAFSQALSFPQWYGANLDALYDCLTDLGAETELTLLHWQDLQDSLGPYAARVLLVLHHASEDNPRLTVALR